MPRKTGRLDYALKNQASTLSELAQGAAFRLPATASSRIDRTANAGGLERHEQRRRRLRGSWKARASWLLLVSHATGTPLTTLPHASPFACQQERAGASIGRSYPCGW